MDEQNFKKPYESLENAPQPAEQSKTEQTKSEQPKSEQPKAEQPIAQQPEAEQSSAQTQPEPVRTAAAPEQELDLDPALDRGIEEPENDETPEPPVEQPAEPEPIAPLMPIIEQAPYVKQSQGEAPKSGGIRLFAGIVAAVLVMCACVTGGYFMGSGRSAGSGKVDLATKPEAKDAKSISEVYAAVDPSVVGIYVYNENGIASSASGVVYKNGYIVTNDHIYDGTQNPKFKIYTYDGKSYDATYVAGDTRSDLAVLKTNATGLKAATFGNSDELAVGETVVAVGCSNGADEEAALSQGCISALNRRLSITSKYTGKFIQTDSAINPGNSGGALCNLYGQVVGITSAKLVDSQYDNVGFAIPTVQMKKVADSLIANGYVKGRAKLGISYYNVTSLAAEINNVPSGLQIAQIDEKSGLYGKAEVKDIITHVNEKELTSAEVLFDVLENSTAGQTLNLTLYSASKKNAYTCQVKLLEDKGSSSYNNSSSSGNSSSGSKTTPKEDDNSSKNQYNSSQFSFPNGN